MDNGNPINVGIGFATGRENFLKVLKTYIESWQESGLTQLENVRLHVFIAYDLTYNNTIPTDFTRISPDIRKRVWKIHFIDTKYIRDEIHVLVHANILDKREADLFFISGYAGMRNAILYAAVKNQIDYLLFLDDDEYPLAVTKAHDVALWSGQQVLGNHLKYIADADVTNGFHCGYISPIPSIRFNEVLTEADFQLFVEAISNDIVSWDNIMRVMRQGGVTYADIAVLVGNQANEVAETNHCKFISGSNLCLNLTDTSRTIPFYNPPGARGEDTFLSTCLHDRKVLRIPSYAFHNGFGMNNLLLSGVLPTTLKPITADSRHVVNRFYKACVGWVRYKPLLLYITRREQYAMLIQEMREKLSKVLPQISEYFDMKDFEDMIGELDLYDRDVEEHYRQFVEVQNLWRKIEIYLANR